MAVRVIAKPICEVCGELQVKRFSNDHEVLLSCIKHCMETEHKVTLTTTCTYFKPPKRRRYMSSPLKTSWTYSGGGSTIGNLCQAIGKECPAELVNIRTDLLLNVSGPLSGYDKERAETAIAMASPMGWGHSS